MQHRRNTQTAHDQADATPWTTPEPACSLRSMQCSSALFLRTFGQRNAQAPASDVPECDGAYGNANDPAKSCTIDSLESGQPPKIRNVGQKLCDVQFCSEVGSSV